MTANEYLKSKEPNTFVVPEEFLQEYAKIKCKELLEIVAEKAKMVETYYNHVDKKYVTEIIQEKEFKGEQEIIFIDKDSIFNAVDLDEFIEIHTPLSQKN